jgi:DNA-binding HxlR family transcriptional regulator
MAGKRTYRDPCGIARALDLVGDRWALLVVRELILGPKRFGDLRAGLGEIAPDVLSERLRQLEQSGVVSRRTLDPPASVRVYELTEWGAELEPVLLSLGRWGSRAPFPAGHHALGVDAFVLALRTTFDPARAGATRATYELRLDGQPYSAVVADGRLEIERGAGASAAATIDTDVGTLSAVLWHGHSLSDAIDDGTLRTSGSAAALKRFPRLFAAPVPVPVPVV